MKYLLSAFIAFYLFFIVTSCKQKSSNKNNDVSVICLRDTNCLLIKLINNSLDTVYVPEKYLGTYNEDNDTIWLVSIDKPKFCVDYFYRYDKIFVERVYTAKQIEDYKSDSIIKVSNQVYFFNQFTPPKLISILPKKEFIVKIHFNIPKRANILQTQFYKHQFINKINDSVDYTFSNFLNFDSSNSNYTTSPILNRYY